MRVQSSSSLVVLVCVCSGITKYIEKISYSIVHLVSELGNNPYFLLKICKLLQSPDSARNCQLFHIELCIFHIWNGFSYLPVLFFNFFHSGFQSCKTSEIKIHFGALWKIRRTKLHRKFHFRWPFILEITTWMATQMPLLY